MTTDEQQRRPCGFVPYPDSGAYGHWRCGRSRWHLGRHRFKNYTVARFPRLWRVRFLWRSFRSTRRLRRIDKPGYRTPYEVRRALYPAKYDPVPVDAPQTVRPDRHKLIDGFAIVALTAALALLAWWLIAHATATTDRPSHGSPIATPTAAYPR